MNAPNPTFIAANGSVHIGQRLRLRRDQLEMTVADVSAITNIRPDFLMAIETLNAAALPSIGYVLGYVRSYAKAIGMDGNDAVADYKRDVEVPQDLGMRDRPHFVPQRRIRLPRGLVPALGVVGFAVMMVGWYGVQTESTAAPMAETLSVAESQVAPAPTIDADMFTLKATAPSWVAIKDATGTTLVSRIFVTGETWQAPRASGYTLSVRDAGAIEVFLGETQLPALGQMGEAVYDAAISE